MIPQKESKLHTKEDRSQGLARGPLVPVSGSGLARHRRSRPCCSSQSFREGRGLLCRCAGPQLADPKHAFTGGTGSSCPITKAGGWRPFHPRRG